MKLSILIPVLDEEDCLRPLHNELVDSLSKLEHDYEIILINDGSSDKSPQLMNELATEDQHVIAVHLRRNYGQTAALMAGIEHAVGDILIPMDADLQNNPADIPNLLEKLEEGYDVVSGWRKKREDNAITRLLPSRMANWLISKVMGVPLHDYGCTLKAYRRDVIEDVRLYGEMHRFIPIYAAWEGARVTEIPVSHRARVFGTSKYGLGRIFRVLLDLFLLYFFDRALDRPIQFFGKFGLYALILSFLTIIAALVLKFNFDISLILTPLPLLAATLGIAGVLFILLGIIAELMTRTYFAASGRMPYSVRDVQRSGSTRVDAQ
jgi:glycosyltransferase involved in cell wall biosynthesis